MSFVDPDTVTTPGSGVVITAAWGQQIVDNDAALWAGMSQPWASWVPDLSLINAANDLEWEAYTHRIGHHINGHFGYRMGASTTYSAGTVEFDLPFEAGNTGPLVVGEWTAEDASTGDFHSGLIVVKSGSTTLAQFVHRLPTSNGGLMSNTVPFTWASGDLLSGAINYHALAAPSGALV